MIVKAHVSPGLRAKTKPQIEQRSSWDHPENSRPSPQCGQRLRSPRRSAVLINFEREGVIHKCVSGFEQTFTFGPCAVDEDREEKGYVTSHLEPPSEAGGLPHRVYQPTALGRRVLKVWTGGGRLLMPEMLSYDEVPDLAKRRRR